jgi:hypothetical protein
VQGALEDELNRGMRAVDAVGGAAGDLADRVGRLHGGTDDPPPGTGGGGSASAGSDGGGRTGPDATGPGSGRSSATPAARLRSLTLSPRFVGVGQGDVPVAVVSDTAPAVPRPGFFASPAGRVVTAVARGLAFPVALLVLVLGFVAVQQRIDRRSPKLALARVERDRVGFS